MWQKGTPGSVVSWKTSRPLGDFASSRSGRGIMGSPPRRSYRLQYRTADFADERGFTRGNQFGRSQRRLVPLAAVVCSQCRDRHVLIGLLDFNRLFIRELGVVSLAAYSR